MSYLEELLPEFRKGAKIRCKDWADGVYVRLKNDGIYSSHPSLDCVEGFDSDLMSDKWEFYQEPEPDWDYIIKNKCLCWFWDDVDRLGESSYGYLARYNEHTQYFYNKKKWYKHCRPVGRDEVTFYEERKDD